MDSDRKETALNLLESFKRLHHTLHKNAFKAMTKDLKPSPMFVLLKLLHASKKGRGMRVSEIAAYMGISVSAVTQIITGLEKEGYIHREMDPKDRRAVLVGLLGKGKTVMEPASKKLEESFLNLVEYLGEENSRILVQQLQKVENYFDK